MYSRREHIKVVDRRLFELERVCEKQIARIKELEDFIEHPPSRPYCTSCYELKTRIKELEEGSCRFNCRTSKEAFIAGYMDGHLDGGATQKPDPDYAYKEWRESK